MTSCIFILRDFDSDGNSPLAILTSTLHHSLKFYGNLNIHIPLVINIPKISSALNAWKAMLRFTKGFYSEVYLDMLQP